MGCNSSTTGAVIQLAKVPDNTHTDVSQQRQPLSQSTYNTYQSQTNNYPLKNVPTTHPHQTNHGPVEQKGPHHQNNTAPVIVVTGQIADEQIQSWDEEREMERFQSLPLYTRRKVLDRNSHSGWTEWAVFNKTVYDCNKARHNPQFMDIIVRKKNEELFSSRQSWEQNLAYYMKSLNFTDKEIRYHLSEYMFGRLEDVSDAEYWDDIRKDAVLIETDLSGDCDISYYQSLYLEHVKRWLKLYRYVDPAAPGRIEGDPNKVPFPLPEDILENLDVLRKWVAEWERFDTHDAELQLREISDISDKTDDHETHELFAKTLRPSTDTLDEFKFGEIDMNPLPDDAVKNDVTTPEQDNVLSLRANRSMWDPLWMMRRRKGLAQYFKSKYKWDSEKLEPFLQWADAMKEGEKKFLALC